MAAARRIALLAAGSLLACRPAPGPTPRDRVEPRPDAPVAVSARDASVADSGRSPAQAPERAAEASQPRWRYLAHGPRPRGIERWRLELGRRDALGPIATDGTSVFVAVALREGELETEAEVLALDLGSGALRWHTPLPGLHGTLEYARGTVLASALPHCRRRAVTPRDASAGACIDEAPGAGVGLDAATGAERFRLPLPRGAAGPAWVAVDGRDRAWLRDAGAGLRSIALPAGTPDARVAFQGTGLATVAPTGTDLVYALRASRTTRIGRRAAGSARSAWERAIPYPADCPAVVVGPVIVLGAFSTPTLAGSARAVESAGGQDLWSVEPPPAHVDACGAVEGAVFYQITDLTLQGHGIADGRRRVRLPVLARMTSPLGVLLDGIFYLSFQGRLEGIDVIDGHRAVTVPTDADAVVGLALWNGRGVAATRGPGLLVGFE